MGSLASGQRRVKSQILDNVYIQGLKRVSVPSFDQIIERVEEQEPAPKALVASRRAAVEGNVTRTSQLKMSGHDEGRGEKVVSPDETEEWAKIEDLITSIGGGLDTDMLVKEFDERMCSVLSSTGGVTAQSVGDWLESLGLAQYENFFIANGFDDTDFLGPDILEDIDLEEIGIADQSHRQKILEAIARFPRMKQFDESQHSVRDWLESIRLLEYTDAFAKHGFHDLERIMKLWDVELTSILDITMLGHRKRILMSLKNTSNGTTNNDSFTKDQTAQLLRDLTPSQESETVSLFKDYTNLMSHHKLTRKQAECVQDENVTRSQQQEDVSCLNRRSRNEEREIDGENSEAIEAAVSHWCHRPEALVKGCCNYNVQYLGSTLVTLLDGTESTKASISKFKRSTENIAKVPNIILSISYRGVKFIDAKSKKVICEHEIGNIFCACQDGDSLNYFAYITRDLETDKHYCHVFTVDSTELATEILLTLGEAFEVAYQIAVSERKQPTEEADALSLHTEEKSIGINSAASNTVDIMSTSIHSHCYSTAL